MNNNGGYVKVFRSMLDWEWYDDTACVRLMLHLLLTANWEAKSWHGQDVHPGQLITSMDKLAETLGTSRSAIRRTLDKLKSSGEVTIQTNNHWTTVTLANWAEYQEVQPTTDRPSGRQTTNHRPTTDRPPATTKEGKKERSKEEESAQAHQPINSVEDFKARCSEVIAVNPDRLAASERKGFFDYWTEKDAKGRMRFQSEKFFDLGRRMDTWQRNADKQPRKFATDKPSPTSKPWVN